MLLPTMSQPYVYTYNSHWNIEEKKKGYSIPQSQINFQPNHWDPRMIASNKCDINPINELHAIIQISQLDGRANGQGNEIIITMIKCTIPDGTVMAQPGLWWYIRNNSLRSAPVSQFRLAKGSIYSILCL